MNCVDTCDSCVYQLTGKGINVHFNTLVIMIFDCPFGIGVEKMRITSVFKANRTNTYTRLGCKTKTTLIQRNSILFE